MLADLLHDALAPAAEEGVIFGVSALPGDTGVWVRMLGDDTRAILRATTIAWGALRLLLTGREAPTIRKS